MSLEAAIDSVALEIDEQADKGSASSDWEARLAVARAKREKVLAQQATKPKPKGVKKPPFVLDNVDLEAETAAFLFDKSSDNKPAVAKSKVEEDAPAPKPAPALVKVVDTPADSLVKPLPRPTAEIQAKPAEKKSRLNKIGLVLVGCFTGLGFGFALGLGLLVGLGWVSPKQFAVKTPETVAPKIATATPIVASAPIATAAPIVDAIPTVFDLQSDALVSMTAVSSTPVVVAEAQSAPDPLAASQVSQSAWLQDLNVISHPDLSTAAFDPDTTHLARFQASDANNPASALAAYIPSPLPQLELAASIAGPTLSGSSLDTDVVVASVTGSGYTDTTWAAARLTDTSPTKLATRSDTDPALNALRFQVSDTNNPVTILSAYAPSPLSGTDDNAGGILELSSNVVHLASVDTVSHELPQIHLNDVAFFAPYVETPQLSYQLAYKPTVLSDIDIPAPSWPQIKEQIASYLPSPAELKARNIPEPEPTFAQAMGLSAEDLQTFDLILLAPDRVKDVDLNAFSARLDETGLPLKSTKKVGFTISKPHIRFYSEKTRLIATSLAGELGVETRDFTSGNRNSTGIEVWMAGSTAVKVAKRRTVVRQPSARTRLNNSIISGLRNATIE